MSANSGLWIGLLLDEASGAHVTVCIRHLCEVDDFSTLMRVMETDIRPLLSVEMRIDPRVTMKGYNHDVPTHTVHFSNPATRLLLERVYMDHYNQRPDYEQYPLLSAHVSVNSPEREDYVQRVLRESGGVVHTATLKRIGGEQVLYAVSS